ncbi:MAG: purine-nucleoside phosphorylase [Oligoflexia bacterium]|nr:purine-nucleoside phosphorylase [Oligoflexia bacterium]
MTDLVQKLSDTTQFIRSHCSLKPRVGMILGSGLGNFVDSIVPEWSCEYSQIPHFKTTSVEGHTGRLILGKIGDVPVAALQGRLHLYEGYNAQEVVFPTRTLAMLGIQVLLVTNAAGGLNKKMTPGDFMVITDHINLMGDNPLKGKNLEQLGPRFPDMTEAYDRSLANLISSCAKGNKLNVWQGVYVGLPGPTYETPAEVRYLQSIGGDAVGMSTVPEVIAANHLGVRVCGVSCITNLAAGLSSGKLSHNEVTTTAKFVEQKFKHLVTQLIGEINAHLDKAPAKR